MSTPNALYFNAYHPKAGFQLYRLEGESLKQITSFKQKLTKKQPVEDLTGGQTSNYAWFNNRLYFFAKGKGMKSGIYSYDQYKVRLVYECERMSNGFAQEGENMLATQVAVKSADSLTYYHVSIDPYFKVKRIPLNDGGMCSEIAWFDQIYYGVRAGILGKLKFYPTRADFIPLSYGEGQLEYVSELTTLNNTLCFFAQRMYGPVLGFINNEGQPALHVLPGKRHGACIETHGKSDYGGDNAYFMVHEPDSSHFMVWDGSNQPYALQSFGRGSRLTGSGVSLKQHIFSISSPTHTNLFQVNGNRLIEQNLRYITKPNYVASYKENLVYLANESRREYLYTSAPLMPPMVTNTSYSVFDFWQNGRKVGPVLAKSINRGGRLRYYMAGGNEEGVFKVDEYTGMVSVDNHKALRTSGQNIYHLEVEVQEKRRGSSIAEVDILVKYARPFSQTNLRETLMFFPDFKRVKTLTTTKLPDGETVMVYDMNFQMVDMLEIRQGAIVLGSYTPGMYLLNVRNKENLYQKIELQ